MEDVPEVIVKVDLPVFDDRDSNIDYISVIFFHLREVERELLNVEQEWVSPEIEPMEVKVEGEELNFVGAEFWPVHIIVYVG